MTFCADDPCDDTIASFALMQADAGALERYWRLAVETNDYQAQLRAAGIVRSTMWIGVDEAPSVSRRLVPQIPVAHRDCALFARWEDWAREFERIYRASPKWRLKEMIAAISETHYFTSWPNRWERQIWKWALSDEVEPSPPFDDRMGITDEAFRQQLRSLVEETDGFCYRCEETRHIVFAPTASLDRIWRHQDHLSEIDRGKLFGYFYDASRPGVAIRAPTAEEERLTALICRPSERQAGWRGRFLERFSRWRR